MLWLFTQSINPGRAPAVTFNLINGDQIPLIERQGHPLIVTFWATSCTICLAEMPDWERFYQIYHAQGVALIAVAMPYDRPDWVLSFAQRFKWNFGIALDPMGTVAEAFGNVSVTPTTFVISPAGKIHQKTIGRIDFVTLSQQLNQWL